MLAAAGPVLACGLVAQSAQRLSHVAHRRGPQSCAPLMLTAPGGGAFAFAGVSEVLRGALPAAELLCAPSAPADTEAGSGPLSAAALVNQVRVNAA
jgi:hypothetical protein